MADHPNAELFKRGYTAFQKGDLDTVRALFDSNVVWHIPGHNHLSGDHAGIDDVLALFGRNFQEPMARSRSSRTTYLPMTRTRLRS